METTKPTPANQAAVQPQRRPNEQGVVNVSGFVKIYDPKSKQIFVEKRA